MNLLRGMLDVNPEKRISMDMALNHEFFTNKMEETFHENDETTEDEVITETVSSKMRMHF